MEAQRRLPEGFFPSSPDGREKVHNGQGLTFRTARLSEYLQNPSRAEYA